MIYFFQTTKNTMIAVKTKGQLKPEDNNKLEWLFSGKNLNKEIVNGAFVGPRKEMISPWSTNAVEISQNMGINNIIRIEEYQIKSSTNETYDPMLEQMFSTMNQDQFNIDIEPESIIEINNIAAYNLQ